MNGSWVLLDVTAAGYRWSEARRVGQVSGLRFHERLSGMANRHLTLGELQAQSGDRVSEVARKLA